MKGLYCLALSAYKTDRLNFVNGVTASTFIAFVCIHNIPMLSIYTVDFWAHFNCIHLQIDPVRNFTIL